MTSADTRVSALTADEAEAFRTAALESGRHEAFFVLLGSVDAPTRAALVSGLPSPALARVEQMAAQVSDVDEVRLRDAQDALAPLLEPAELLYHRGLLHHRSTRYAQALELYAEAFRLGAGGRERFYNAACAAALSGDGDAAFDYLGQAVDAGWLLVDATRGDEDLEGLQGDPRWGQMLGRMQQALDDRLAVLPEEHEPLATVKLPDPGMVGTVSVEAAMARRRSERTYTGEPLRVAEIAQLLWAAYGTTSKPPGAPERLRGGLKTAPSAGALYPLEIYVVAGDVEGLLTGVYRYRPEAHDLVLLAEGDKRPALCQAALDQDAVRSAPASLVYSALFSRTTGKYGSRGRDRYVSMDLGHSAQNVYLECVSLGLGTTAIGAFFDADVQLVVGMTRPEEPLYIMPIGRLARER